MESLGVKEGDWEKVAEESRGSEVLLGEESEENEGVSFRGKRRKGKGMGKRKGMWKKGIRKGESK